MNIIRKVPCLKVACGIDAGKFMFKGNDFEVFNNGVDIKKFKFNADNRKNIRKELGINENTFVVGLTARVDRQKNPLFLLDIFNCIQKQKEDSVLVYTGEGDLKNAVKEKAKELGIENKVLLLGRRNDVEKITSAYDIFLMPSLYEGLSISIVEAQINGLKCYTSTNVDKDSNATGNVEFISLEKSAEEWAKEILESDNSRDMNVTEKIPDKFDSKKSYQKIYEYYEKHINTSI